MALTAAAPVAAAEPVDIVVEDDSEDTAVDFEESNEEAEVAAEEVEEAVDEADTSDVETEAADFGDGEEAAPAVGEGDTTEDGWVKMSAYRPSYADSTMEAKYDEQTQTLYLRVSQPEEMQDANSSVTPWYKYLKEKDLVTEVKKIVIGEGITRVGSKNFTKVSGRDFYDSLEEVVLPSTVTEIGTQAFSGDKTLKKINLENVSKVGRAAFSSTSLDSVTFNTDEVTLGGNAFAGSSLTSFKAKKVNFTGDSMFYNCKLLKDFEVESSLEEIPDDTFDGCDALTSFDFKDVKKLGFLSFGENVKNFSVPEFKDVVKTLDRGEADYGVLPIENTSAGTVSGIYDMILDYDICVVGEESVDVKHVLAAIPGTSLDKIEKVYSHPQGLMQCKGFLDEHPDWDQVKVANTAISAKKVADDNKPVKAAICSERAAKMYGLEILKREVNDEGNNTTRFVIMSKKKQYRKDAGKVSISFSVPHESGSLYNILTHFMFNNVSMSNIESRPLPGRKWEYGFYVDVIGNLDDPAIRNSLAGIKEETKDFRILGNF